MWKVPIYNPPTDLKIANIGNYDRIKDLYICLRVVHGKDDKLASVKCSPSNKHMYLIPELHSNAPVKVNIDKDDFQNSKIVNHKSTDKPERPMKKVTDGIKVFVHNVIGYAQMNNKNYRISCMLQSNKEI